MPHVVLPIKVAETGAVVNVELSSPYHEDSVAELKYMLASAAGVTVEDQILLIGPPYKPLKRLDPPLVFSSSSRDDDISRSGRRQASALSSSLSLSSSPIGEKSRSTGDQPSIRSIYLYSRRTLDARAPFIPEEARLSVQLPELPTSPPEPPPQVLQSLLLASSSSSSSSMLGGSSSSMSGASAPLGQALSQYERLVSLNLAKGQAYVDRGRRLLEACVRCLEEQRIQRDAGDVALANLMDHFGSISRDFNDLSGRHRQQATAHIALLDRFHPNLKRLEGRQLHPVLKEALRESLAQDRGSSAGMDCAVIRKATTSETVTLLDCVPVGRVTDWYRECKDTRERLGEWMGDLGQALHRLEDGVEAQKMARLTVDLGALSIEVEGLKRQLAEQEKGLASLERQHGNVVERVRSSLSLSLSMSGEAVGVGGAAFGSSSANMAKTCQWLEDLLNRQAGVMAALEGIDHDMLSQGRTLANRKTQTARWLASHLLAISRLQGDIQSLRSNISIGDQAMNTERRHFTHLEHLERLAAAYQAMLIELTRRRAYGRLFEIKVKAALDDVAHFREGEITARAEFLRQHAVHLMPVFSQIFPTMQDRPPHFQAKALTPEQRLPAVKAEDVDIGVDREGEGGEGEEQLMKGYMSCLGGSREGDGAEEGGRQRRMDASMVIMPQAESCPTQAELEKRCVQQDLVIAQLKGKVQTLQLQQQQQQAAVQLQQQQRGRRGDDSPVDNQIPAEVKRLQEQNESLRSAMSTILSVMEDMRSAAIAVTTSSMQGEEEKKEGDRAAASARKPATLDTEPTQQQIVDVVDDVASTVITRLRSMGSLLQSKITDLESKSAELSTLQNTASRSSSQKKISFCEFNVGDVALFLPTSHQGENRVYLAFHMNCPHRYLSNESLESIRAGGSRFPDFILGKIIYIDTLCAQEVVR